MGCPNHQQHLNEQSQLTDRRFDVERTRDTSGEIQQQLPFYLACQLSFLPSTQLVSRGNPNQERTESQNLTVFWL